MKNHPNNKINDNLQGFILEFSRDKRFATINYGFFACEVQLTSRATDQLKNMVREYVNKVGAERKGQAADDFRDFIRECDCMFGFFSPFGGLFCVHRDDMEMWVEKIKRYLINPSNLEHKPDRRLRGLVNRFRYN